MDDVWGEVYPMAMASLAQEEVMALEEEMAMEGQMEEVSN